MKKGFASCLYYALKKRGIKTFLDMEELPKGEDVRKHMLEAAKSALIGVPIFTEEYGSSDWCLDELLKMIESMRNHQGKVIPVFFDVTPDDLRMKDGKFAKNFQDHLRTRNHKEEKIELWKDALREASWLDGFWLEKHGGLRVWDANISNTLMGR